MMMNLPIGHVGGNMNVLGFDHIIGQKLPIRRLQTFLQNATLPHALIFSGIAGIGKRTVARTVAMALNCQNNPDCATPCGHCLPCRQIISGSHPDVLLIEPQGNYLRIDQIRKLLSTLALKPFTAQRRVVVIADAQEMNKEAANALLKVLEEPPPDTVLILTTLQTSDLLPTIVSRCRNIRFNPLGADHIMSLLKDTDGIDERFIDTAAALSAGSVAKAKRLSTIFWRDQRNWLIQAAGVDHAANTGKRSIALALTFSAQLSQKKEQVPELLEILKTWIRDLTIWPYRPQSVINNDYNKVLALTRPHMDDGQLLGMWNAIEKAQKDIAAKVNIRLTLDVMALRMAGFQTELSCLYDG
jgi:DNA polymerase-3 subunit delta'